MRSSLRAVALALALGALGAGCAGESSGSSDADRCPEQCERGRKCPGVPAMDQTCDDWCLFNDAVAVESNCHDQHLKSVNCLADLEDICTGLTACKDELTAVQTCEHNYCQAHKGDEVCVNVP